MKLSKVQRELLEAIGATGKPLFQARLARKKMRWFICNKEVIVRPITVWILVKHGYIDFIDSGKAYAARFTLSTKGLYAISFDDKGRALGTRKAR